MAFDDEVAVKSLSVASTSNHDLDHDDCSVDLDDSNTASCADLERNLPAYESSYARRAELTDAATGVHLDDSRDTSIATLYNALGSRYMTEGRADKTRALSMYIDVITMADEADLVSRYPEEDEEVIWIESDKCFHVEPDYNFN